MEDLLDDHRDNMAPAPESTPHPTTERYNSQIQGAALLREPEGNDLLTPSADFTQLQTGLMRPLRTTGLFTESTCPWVNTAWVSGHCDNIMTAHTAKDKEKEGKPKATLGITSSECLRQPCQHQ